MSPMSPREPGASPEGPAGGVQARPLDTEAAGPAAVRGSAVRTSADAGGILRGLLSAPLQAKLGFGWASAAELVRQAVNVALLVGLVLAGAGVLPLLAVAIPASAVSLAFTIPLVRRQVSFEPSFHLGRLWRLL